MSNNRGQAYMENIYDIFFVLFLYILYCNIVVPSHGGDRHFYLYLLYLSTILYVLSFIFELCQNENPLHKEDSNRRDRHSPKIKYTKAELLNLKSKVYIIKMDIGTCNHLKKYKNKMKF